MGSPAKKQRVRCLNPAIRSGGSLKTGDEALRVDDNLGRLIMYPVELQFNLRGTTTLLVAAGACALETV
jgi:hypothetical protein